VKYEPFSVFFKVFNNFKWFSPISRFFMHELDKEYKIGNSNIRPGHINWIGFWTLYKKEVLRFFIVWIQTLLSPVITSLLFLVEVTLAIIAAACTRSIFIAIIAVTAFSFFISIEIVNFFYVITFAFLGSFILGAVGFITGLWAEKFDHMASITNFLIVPLSFLSGTFYSIERLPNILQKISLINPFFYIIDGFRAGFIGTSDGSLKVGIIYLLILSFLTWFIAYYLFKKGYKIKT